MLWDPNKDKPAEVVDEIEQLILKTADYFETHDWFQGDYCDGKGGVCMYGGLITVETGQPKPQDGFHDSLSIKAIFRLRTHLGSYPSVWNDVSGREKSEVIAVLREAAKL